MIYGSSTNLIPSTAIGVRGFVGSCGIIELEKIHNTVKNFQ